MKNVFLDTNILLEIILQRSNKDICSRILKYGQDGDVCLYASHLTFANIAYVMHRYSVSRSDIYKAERFLESIITVLSMTGNQLRMALQQEVKDFEDMLQYQCAIDGHCDCIVTINVKDFLEFANIPILTPQEFLDKLEEGK